MKVFNLYVSRDKKDKFGFEILFLKTGSTRVTKAVECDSLEGKSVVGECTDQAELLL